MTGRLALVMGPSGAGKDSLIAALAGRFAGDSRFAFPRRIVTRPADASEPNETMSPEEFRAAEARGDFLFAWDAHGFSYAIPGRVEKDLAEGRIALVNVSRTVLAEARRRFPGLMVLLVTAPPAVLARRLAGRGRETEAEIAERLARSPAFGVEGADVVEIVNDGDLKDAVDRAARALESLAPTCRS